MTQQTVQLIAGCGLLVTAALPRLWTVATRIGFVLLAVSVFGGWFWLQGIGFLTLVVAIPFEWRRERRLSRP